MVSPEIELLSRIHDAVDESNQQPARDQFGLACDDALQQCVIGAFGLSCLR